MGLLDDAIRDHLDLKRRRGADPAEIERAEREALGPVRRDPFEHELDGPDAGSGEPPFDEAGEEQPRDPGQATVHDHERDRGELVEEPAPAPARADAGAAAEQRRQAPPAAAEETAEYDVEAELADGEQPAPASEPLAQEPLAQEPPSEDDVLEETPEFFQDTPDHDRLWFEQRPPRDFDFDG